MHDPRLPKSKCSNCCYALFGHSNFLFIPSKTMPSFKLFCEGTTCIPPDKKKGIMLTVQVQIPHPTDLKFKTPTLWTVIRVKYSTPSSPGTENSPSTCTFRNSSIFAGPSDDLELRSVVRSSVLSNNHIRLCKRCSSPQSSQMPGVCRGNVESSN